jgi:hypothetical protein
METKIQGEPIFDDQALKLLQLIKELKIDVYWEKEWRAYSIIENEISSSDALLAIVEETWQSSSWMASEVTWANGDIGSGLGSHQHMKRIPIFLYPILEREKWGWLKNYAGPIILDKDIQKAALTIKNELFAPPHKLPN